MRSETLAVWLLTFALHAGVLLLLAWLLDRGRLRAQLAWRELLWRGALFGALFSASLQVFSGMPAPARFAFASAAPIAVADIPRQPVVAVREAAPALDDSAGAGCGHRRRLPSRLDKACRRCRVRLWSASIQRGGAVSRVISEASPARVQPASLSDVTIGIYQPGNDPQFAIGILNRGGNSGSEWCDIEMNADGAAGTVGPRRKR